MLARMLSYADRHGMLPPAGSGVLAAVSGGADSVCMLFLLKQAAEARGLRLVCAHFDHMLREGSAGDASFTEALCRAHGIEFTCGRGDVAACAAARGMGCEEAGRAMRYAFLRRAMAETGCARIATAHNADDNAETVLLHLARGAGARGLAGIPPVRGEIIRPLLWATREEILRWLEAQGLPHVEDPTNHTDLYARNRVRRRILPALRELNPRFAQSVTASAELLREDDRCLNTMAEDFVAGRGELPASELAALPDAVASRAVRLLAPCRQDRDHVTAVLALCRSGGPGRVSLRGCAAAVAGGVLRFETGSAPAIPETELSPGPNRAGPFTVTLEEGVMDGRIHKSFTTFVFKKSAVCGTILVRPRRAGDSIRLSGRGVTKSLKKLFNESHIPPDERDAVPVLADGAGVLGVWGLGADERAVPRPGDGIWIIKFCGREDPPAAKRERAEREQRF